MFGYVHTSDESLPKSTPTPATNPEAPPAAKRTAIRPTRRSARRARKQVVTPSTGARYPLLYNIAYVGVAALTIVSALCGGPFVAMPPYSHEEGSSEES
jgi:hypothetical protein